ncbi:L,D-transpeptidase family protein [Lacrimispora sp.]|uniref:L,D-transpeptidase family protein n=1 Tax=Lacrimispora sp. TaxID=2719234 RepID=UPI002FDA1514
MELIGRRYKRLLASVFAVVLSLSASLTGYGEPVSGPGANLGAGGTPSTNGVTIYVSKRTKVLTLKQNGALIAQYPVALGASSEDGNKKVEGDMRTPSGQFYVCTRNDKSVAYLSLGLSYPGIKDAERGFADGIITEAERDEIVKANLEGRQPPWDTALGGAIMIHGERIPDGTTSGCVAVDNTVMDVLWSYCNLGVPVTIGP